jgi:hypothetical protein
MTVEALPANQPETFYPAMRIAAFGNLVDAANSSEPLTWPFVSVTVRVAQVV